MENSSHPYRASNPSGPHRVGNVPRHRVFDDIQRTECDRGRYSVESFEFLNRSPWKSAGIARDKIEEWFAKFPLGKQNELRGRLRGDDRAHSGGLLELVTHEFLLELFGSVDVEPEVSGGRPDFSVVCDEIQVVVECTVAQESDKGFGALKREQAVLDVVDAVNAGPYKLIVDPMRVGSNQPSRSKLKSFLESKLAHLQENCAITDESIGRILNTTMDWRWEDWHLHFQVMIIGNYSEDHAIGARQKGFMRAVDANIISRSLERKSDAYKNLGLPYLVIVAEREGAGDIDDLMDALLGPEEWLHDWDSGNTTMIRSLNGFFGSPERPRNRHVSAVLYKRGLKDVWQVSNQWMTYDTDRNLSYRPANWILMHNPEALQAFPSGRFTFALEYIWRDGSPKAICPTSTLNSLLNLPDRWPGEEH